MVITAFTIAVTIHINHVTAVATGLSSVVCGSMDTGSSVSHSAPAC